MTTFDELFIQHVVPAYDKQVFLSDSIGMRHKWAFDLQAGTVTFADRLTFSVQILGTESQESNTWLWSWANQESNLPPEHTAQARDLRAFGEEHYIDVFTTPELPLSQQVNGVHISLVASCLQHADCFYRGEYPNGALYLLIDDPRFQRRISNILLRIARIFPDAIDNLVIPDHREAFAAYLHSYDLTVQADGDSIRGTSAEGFVEATFNADGSFNAITTG